MPGAIDANGPRSPGRFQFDAGPQGRNPRQVATATTQLGPDIVGEEAAAGAPGAAFEQGQGQLRLRAVETGIALGIGGHGQAVFFVPGDLLVDVVINRVVEHLRLPPGPSQPPGNADVDVGRHFLVRRAAVNRQQADLELARGQVGAIGIKLLGGGIPFRARQLGGQAVRGRQIPGQAGRQGESRLVVVGHLSVRPVFQRLHPSTELQVAEAGVPLLADKEAERLGLRAGNEGLLADGGKVTVVQLQAHHAAPSGQRPVQGLGPQLPGLVVEHGARLARGLHFHMFVVIGAEGELHGLDSAVEAVKAAQIDAGLLEVEVRTGKGQRVFAGLLVFLLGGARQAVGGVQYRDADAKVSAVGDPRQAGSAPAAVAVAVAESPAALIRAALIRIGGRKTGDAEIAGFPVVGVQMPGERAAAPVQSPHHRLLPGGGIAAQFEAPGHRPVGNHRRHATVDHVHDATGRGTAEQQGGRTPDDLDPVGEQWLDGDRVVSADIRYVEGTDAVGEHLHPGAALSADHGPA